uniref:U6 snRNA phosphodiesterase 1 n=1 Tax=Bionectria ochroleuca TaxID=29856 RepID=A0A8H7NMC5_BIOOC
MALVDYSSSSSASTESLHQQPPAKRRKAGDSETSTLSHPSSRAVKVDGQDGKPTKRSVMPPLPSTFHDLYASTVRQSVVDDPSLHHGRKRQTPHIVGNWPSHLYIEWNLTSPEYDMLVKLVQDVETELQGKVKLHNFLTSDLGSPLPLHISLSRPLSLTTANKDDFLEKASGAIQAGAVAPFAVTPRTLAWYKSPDSDRIFLIIRVASSRDLLGGKDAGAR